MKKSRKLTISIILLLIFMTVGYLLLLLAYSGARWIALIVFLVYIFVVYFLIKTTRPLIKALKEKEKYT
ncbi:MAG TPA: hypothetical protein IAA76_07265 [Candidatus Ornithospirochaeta stercorigallinarum]|nr:hypothetical protein [Candidatus Ornithospirochaeta stercorigallinarum]